MARKPVPKKAKPAPARVPNLPQHNLPEQLRPLLTMGFDEDPDFGVGLDEETPEAELPALVDKLISIAEDDTYYSYSEVDDPDPDPRCFAPLQAIRALCYLCEDNVSIAPRLLQLFKKEDDYLLEELPMLFACIGLPAVDLLCAATLDKNEDSHVREGASTSLVDMVELEGEIYDRVRTTIEKALSESTDAELNAYYVFNLMDLGAAESLPDIEMAYLTGKVETEIIDIDEVREHFLSLAEDDGGAPSDGDELSDGEFEPGSLTENDTDEESDEPVSVPFVAGQKPGRNDPCFCGSGKKYKKCHGVG